MADEKTFRLKIISPDRVFYEGDITMLELATSEGEMGIYAEHMPLTAVLMPDTIKIHVNGEIKKAALHSGFVEILGDRVTVLAEVVEWPEEIDVNRANEARVRAERRLASHDDNINVMRAELALKRSLARLGAVD